MALMKHSLFYYGILVTTGTRFLNFSEEGGPELLAEIAPKGYTLQGIAEALQDALNDAGTHEYVVTVDRATRKLTVSASGEFSLLAGTGSNVGQGAWAVIGFSAVDIEDVEEVEGDLAVGKAHTTQFPIQGYVPSSQNRKALNAVVSKSASGKNVTVQSYGEERFVKGNLQYITNFPQPADFFIRNNPTGVEDAEDLLEFLTDKEKVEFMEDVDDVETYETLLLESTPTASDGTGFELREWFDRGTPGYFETGELVFKVVD